MGRQIAVKLSREKEKEFSEFLKEKNCVIIANWSEKKRINVLKDIPQDGPYLRVLHIWNRDFSFNPSFVKIKKEYKRSKYNYGFMSFGKPLIEYSRKPIYRIYWEKYFTTNNPNYNVEEFEKWYNEVVKWIKKHCKYTQGVYLG